LNFSLNDFSRRCRAEVADQGHDLLDAVLDAHSAIGTDDCATVKLVRTTKGEASVIDEVPAAITTSGTLAWSRSAPPRARSG
jgi:hypothetical protein